MLEGVSVDTPPELVTALIAERIGWTYEQILDQPRWLIEALLSKWALESEKQKENQNNE